MKLDIKLADPLFCDGCPAFMPPGIRWGYCRLYDLEMEEKDVERDPQRGTLRTIRPSRCIKENGQ